MDKVFDEKMLRQYVKRQISGKNSVIAALTHKFNLRHSVVYGDIYSSFIKGNLDSSYSNKVLSRIYDHIAENPTKKYTPYNYFNLDTLIAFNCYLDHIIDEIDVNRINARRSSTTQKDFLDALKDAPKWLIENAGKEETGYYNLNKTVDFLMQNGSYFLPEKTMSKAEFEKKYNTYFCQKELVEYLDYKHPKQPYIQEPVEEEQENEEDDQLFEYNDKWYYIVRQDYYFDINMFPIKSIIAYCVDGRDTLIGTFNLDNSEYKGPLYDNEGNFRMSEEETGIELISKKDSQSNSDEAAEKTPEPLTNKTLEDLLIEEEDNMLN